MRRDRIVLSLVGLTMMSACANSATAVDDEPTATGKSALIASLSGLQAGNYTFTLPGIEGAVDLPDGSLIAQSAGRPSALRIGSDFYLRYLLHGSARSGWVKVYDEAAATATAKQRAEIARAKEVLDLLDGEKWVRTDEKKIRAAAEEDDQSGLEQLPAAPTAAAPDVTGATTLVGAVTSAEQSGTTITGTLDATKVDPAAGILSGDPYYSYGPKANAMPFRAVLDARGRLTAFTVEVPGRLKNAASAPPEAFPSDAPTEAPEPPVTITISRYGETTVPAAPRPAPELTITAATHDMLSNDVD